MTLNSTTVTRIMCLSLMLSLSACGDKTNSANNTNMAYTQNSAENITKTLESTEGIHNNIIVGTLATPAGFEANLENNGIRLRWMPVTDTAISYRVYWSEQADVSPTSAYTDVYEATYLHDGIITGTTYYFRISALRESTESPLSTMLIVPTVAASHVGSDAAE